MDSLPTVIIIAAAVIALGVLAYNQFYLKPKVAEAQEQAYPAEAAFRAGHRAPGLTRPFAMEDFSFADPGAFNEIRRENREAMLAEMTDKQRQVFVLHYKYGWTQQQIADYLCIDQTTVRDRLRLAAKKVKKILS